MDSPSQGSQPTPTRPKMLTVLCYLTLFASSWIVVSSFTTLMNPEQVSLAFSKELIRVEDQFEEVLKKDPVAGEKLQNLIESTALANSSSNMRDYGIFSLISNMLTLIGASFMLRLKRNGFRLYLLGTILGIVSPLVVFGTSNLLGLAYAIYAGFFGLVFVLLYWSRLKYMDQ